MREHSEAVRNIQLDIIKQVIYYEEATGDVKDSYKKIVLDKIWKLRKMVADFYYLCNDATNELEEMVGEPRAYRMMSQECLRYVEPSYISSVHSANAPYFQHLPSFH